MNRLLIAAALMLATTWSLSGQTPQGQPAPNRADEIELERTEREWAAAYVRNDRLRIDQTLADEFTVTDSAGKVQKKQELMADLGSRTLKFDLATVSEVEVRVYENAAVVTGRLLGEWEYNRQENMASERFTDVFVKRQGRWQCVARHLSRIPQR